MRHRPLAAISVALLLIAGAVSTWLWGRAVTADRADGIASISLGGPFSLVASTGGTVSDQTYRGKFLLVNFGYTFCPDACPTTLNDISVALERLGPLANKVQPLFITVNPARDTANVMADYVKSFDPRIVGLTGTPAQIAAVAKEYRVYYAPQRNEDGTYLVDHSSVVYVMGPDGKFLKLIRGDTSGERMASELKDLIQRNS
jgi:protein SCO1